MLKRDFRRDVTNYTVSDLINELQKLPADARVTYCGSNVGYIHVDENKSAICIDHDDLEEHYLYIENENPDVKEVWSP